MPRAQFAFLLLWTALLAIGGAALFRGESGVVDLQSGLQALEDRLGTELRATHEMLRRDLGQWQATGHLERDPPAVARAPAQVEDSRAEELLARLGALEQAILDLQDRIARNDLTATDFAAHAFRPEAFANAAALGEEQRMQRFYGWDFARILAEFGAPTEARLTGNQQNLQWLYVVPPQTLQFIFHDGIVGRTNLWED